MGKRRSAPRVKGPEYQDVLVNEDTDLSSDEIATAMAANRAVIKVLVGVPPPLLESVLVSVVVTVMVNMTSDPEAALEQLMTVLPVVLRQGLERRDEIEGGSRA